MKVLCTICARGGSKGIRVNLRLVAGKPLLAHTIELAVQFDLFDAVAEFRLFDYRSRQVMELGLSRDRDLSSDRAGKYLFQSNIVAVASILRYF